MNFEAVARVISRHRDPMRVLEEIERQHEARRRDQIRVLSAQAYVPQPNPWVRFLQWLGVR